MQRGFNWVALVAIIVAIALVGLVADWGFSMYKHQLEDADKKGFDRGAKTTAEAFEKRDNQQLEAAAQQIQKLLLQNQDLTARLTKTAQRLALEIEKGKANDRKDAEALLARLDSGALQLRDGRVEITACADDGPAAEVGERAAHAGASPGGAPRRSCAGFSRETEQFLLGEAERANAIVRERNACVAIAKNDRAELERLAAERR